MRNILLALLMTVSISANAQYMGTVPPNVEAGFNYTTDTDKFSTRYMWVGGAIDNGFGIRYGVGHGSGNDAAVITQKTYATNSTTSVTSNVSYNSQVLQATYMNLGENHDFQGAIGVKRINSTVGSLTDTQDVIIGNAELKLIMTDTLTIGATISRDVVETAGNTVHGAMAGNTVVLITDGPIANIINGTSLVTATTAAVDLDLQLSDNLTVFAQVGEMFFSNSNERTFFNTKTTYSVLPDQGISIFARTKYQHDSNPTDDRNCIDTTVSWNCVITPYFSPEQRFSIAPGVQYRKPFNGLVFTSSLEYGKQWTTIQSESSSSNIYSWMLGLQTSPGRKTGTTFGVTVFGTNANITGASGDYNWYGLYSWIKAPL